MMRFREEGRSISKQKTRKTGANQEFTGLGNKVLEDATKKINTQKTEDISGTKHEAVYTSLLRR